MGMYDEFLDLDLYEYDNIGQYQSVKREFFNRLFTDSYEYTSSVDSIDIILTVDS